MTIKMAQPRPQQFSKKLKQDIQQQLCQTMTTLRLLPLNARDRPNMPKSSWGEFKQIAMLSSPQYRTPIRRKATPQEISKMDFWLIALGDLPEDERRIAMARACGIPWRRQCWRQPCWFEHHIRRNDLWYCTGQQRKG